MVIPDAPADLTLDGVGAPPSGRGGPPPPAAPEGGPRVPAIMRWPGRIAPGSVCRRMASTLDVLPTVAAVTQAVRDMKSPRHREAEVKNPGTYLLTGRTSYGQEKDEDSPPVEKNDRKSRAG